MTDSQTIQEKHPNLKTTLSPKELLDLKTQLPRSLLNFISLVKKRLRTDWDLVIAITGEEGSGKSELALWLGFLIDRGFDLVKNIAYLPSEKDIKDKFNKLNRYAFFDIDEAVKALHKHKWFDNLQQAIVEMYATERFQNKASAVLIPRFRDLTENFRNHRIKIWINILVRDADKEEAIAIAYLRDSDKDVKDPWYCDANAKMKAKRFNKKTISEITPMERLSLERKTKNYFFDFKFPKLPKKLREDYDILKEESRKVKLETIEDKLGKRAKKWRKVVKRMVHKFKRANPILTQLEIGAEFGLPQQDISELLREKMEKVL